MMGRSWGGKAVVARLRLPLATAAAAALGATLAQCAPKQVRAPATHLARLALPISSVGTPRKAPADLAECDEQEETIATGWSTITLPRRCDLPACEPLRPARVLAARIADDETFLALARRHREHRDSDPVRRRIQELETLLARHRGRHAELTPRCRVQVDAWLERERERRSSHLHCDAAYDPLCCP